LKKIIFIFRGSSPEHKVDTSSPSDFRYGYDELNEEKGYIVAPRKNRSFLRKLLYVIEYPFNLATHMGLPLEIYPMFRKKLKQANFIFAVNDAVSLALLFYKRKRLINSRVITLFQSLSERSKTINKHPRIKKWIKKNLETATKVWTLSKVSAAKLISEYGLKPNQVEVFYFGVDVDYWNYIDTSSRRESILSVGNDRRRDYKTLVSALEDKQKCTIVSTKTIPHTQKNIDVINGISNDELRNLYQKSKFIVIPCKSLRYESSGLSSILQAMACGCPVITSRNAALEELFVEREHILFFDPQNVNDLNQKIASLQHDEKLRSWISESARANVLAKHTALKMAEQISAAISNAPKVYQ
jgi:glycosyltransferase involved in cell wall biosynthesis